MKARLVKFDGTGSGRTDEELETTIRQVIDQALVSEKVIDVYDAAGIKKPDISVLSEEFLLELKGMAHKNVAIEVLKKLLNDEIKARARTNIVQSRSLMDMLEDSIKRYHNKILSAAEVIEELIKVSKEITAGDKQAADMGLTEYEYAFYTAVANNDSAKELMQQEKLRELAVVLTERVRQNASIDWTIKESVKAKLKVIVKRTLRHFGYPPDMQKLATELVLRQAEMLGGWPHVSPPRVFIQTPQQRPPPESSRPGCVPGLPGGAPSPRDRTGSPGPLFLKWTVLFSSARPPHPFPPLLLLPALSLRCLFLLPRPPGILVPIPAL